MNKLNNISHYDLSTTNCNDHKVSIIFDEDDFVRIQETLRNCTELGTRIVYEYQSTIHHALSNIAVERRNQAKNALGALAFCNKAFLIAKDAFNTNVSYKLEKVEI